MTKLIVRINLIVILTQLGWHLGKLFWKPSTLLNSLVTYPALAWFVFVAFAMSLSLYRGRKAKYSGTRTAH